jgi:hypothetical protein
MTGTYTVTDVEVIGAPDDNGVSAYNIHVSGVEQGLFMRAKRAPEVGQQESGEIKRETAKNGKQYYRFYREQRQGGGNSEVMVKLEAIHSDIKTLLGGTQTELLNPEEEQARKQAERDAQSLGKDVIHDVDEDEPIKLEDIPF